MIIGKSSAGTGKNREEAKGNMEKEGMITERKNKKGVRRGHWEAWKNNKKKIRYRGEERKENDEGSTERKKNEEKEGEGENKGANMRKQGQESSWEKGILYPKAVAWDWGAGAWDIGQENH